MTGQQSYHYLLMCTSTLYACCNVQYLHVIGVWKSSRHTVHVIVPVFLCRFLLVKDEDQPCLEFLERNYV